MGSIRIINRPQFFTRSAYDEAIENIVYNLKKETAVKAILRFGNITTPGISDIDLMVVFASGQRCVLNGFENYPTHLTPLFTHGIMALQEDHFNRNNFYTAWSDYHLLHGSIPSGEDILTRTGEQSLALKHQTALEFIMMNYIDLKIQLEYGVIKLRSTLQHLKGIRYDLEFLEITDSWMHPMIAQLQYWINHWFENTPSDKELISFIMKFEKAYDRFTKEILAKSKLFLPQQNTYPIAKNISLNKSGQVSYQRKGFLLPRFISSLTGSKYIKLQNKFNNFTFTAPISNIADNSILTERLKFFAEMRNYNSEYLPNFTTLTTGITAKLI